MDTQAAPSDPSFIFSQEAYNLVQNLVIAALLECCSVDEFNTLKKTTILESVTDQACGDLWAFAYKDPAARRDPVFVARAYTSYVAVLHYRVANWVHLHFQEHTCHRTAQSLASIISKRGKLLSGAEIHYRSRIGARFIIDHGFGTVIGETTRIGDDCYILGSVTLGARGISGNMPRLRHPQIGHRVQVGAFSSILGCIHVGDDVFIGPGCIVTEDVPPKARVQLRTSLQVLLTE